jgi:hypothetical protein
MLAKLRPRLNYANVMATVAVFIALGGGAYAASKVPKNSVGTKQLKDHSVTTKKIKPGSITRPDLAFPLASTAAVGSTPVALTSGNSADVAKTSLHLNGDGKALNLASVQLRAGKGGASVSLTLVHNTHRHALGSATLGPNTTATQTGLLQCNDLPGLNNFTLRVTVNSGTVTVGQRSLSDVALPGA